MLASLAEVGARFLILELRRGSRPDPGERAVWLHRSCATILRRLGVAVEFRGLRPAQGLIVSNHLSYLDIPVYAAAMPCVFVAKREVRDWPGFGFFARCGGTIFIDRQSRAGTDAAARQIAEVLRAGVAVLLFPEGTSTDGSAVLRFHPSLLDPAIQLGAEMSAAAIGYRVRGGEERELCYYGDIRFAPHLLAVLGRSGLSAKVEFYPERQQLAERKAAALELRERVVAMRTRMMHSEDD